MLRQGKFIGQPSPMSPMQSQAEASLDDGQALDSVVEQPGGNQWPLGTAVTNARVASLRGLSVGPVSLSTTPVPLRKIVRSSRADKLDQAAALRFRWELGSGASLLP